MDDNKDEHDDNKLGVDEESDITPSDSPEVKPAIKKVKRGRPTKKAKSTMASSVGSEERVTVTSLLPGKMIIRGAPSGEEYVFDKAGAAVSVRSQDIEFLREKNRKLAACCGSGSVERKYFDIP
ncbi:hypothetical protein LCGC14_0508650 [marine sediment metagenome]|uniref:Uncharacterized protein n=1 Tax=marine sediment metagenome TaxID=412755 RepID=A0A0F9UNG6_9ZZZZ